MAQTSIDDYHAAQSAPDRAICDALRAGIDQNLPEAESRIWHAHPVWFLERNPIVGYSKLKDSVRLLFWSGQSFPTAGLSPEGKFKAAEKRFRSHSEVDRDLLQQWLADSRAVQWDYRNIVKRKGRLERLR